MTPSLSVPCLHRIHTGLPRGSFRLHRALGVSIERTDLVARLDQLNQAARVMGLPERAVLVTFDDGWAEPAGLARSFGTWRQLQPVLFLTSGQLAGDRSLLPLPRLYEWCAASGTSLDEFESQGMSRQDIKLLPEREQHALLDDLGIPRVSTSPEVLAVPRVRDLMAAGWLVGSHGHDHHDQRFDGPATLLPGLRGALATVRAFGGEPWLAWPEGRCTSEMCGMARAVGFERQFSLRVEAGSIAREDLVHRVVWR